MANSDFRMNPMRMRGGGRGFKWPILLLGAVVAAVYWFANQKEVPLTGRHQVVSISRDQEMALGLQSYKEVLSQSQVVTEGPEAAAVKAIGEKLAAVAVKLVPDVKDFEWQFNLIQSEQVNAFALPGGYTAVYSGLLPVAKNPDGLAVVMGHEIAHALARHGAERMAHQTLAQGAQILVGIGASDMDPNARMAVMTAFGAGAQFGFMLPFSREHETEADYIGLKLLAMACFDPTEAPLMWERMNSLAGADGGARPPEFASTHPNPTTRVENFKKWMPEAIGIYEQSCGRKPPGAARLSDPS